LRLHRRLLKKELDSLQVKLLPLSVNWDGKTLTEGTNESFADYYEILKTLDKLPTTSQPSIGFITGQLSRGGRGRKKVLAITLSPVLAATYDSARSAAEKIGPDKAAVINSMSCTSNVKYLARIAARYEDDGKAFEDIVFTLRKAANGNGAVMMVNDIKFLKMGGRLQGAQYIFGMLLSVRPLLKMKDGFLVHHKTVRGLAEALSKMVEAVPDRLIYLTVQHCGNLQGAQECISKLKTRFSGLLIELEDLSPVIGTHLGNGAVGIVYCAKHPA
jgi:DegV family protein with EDD domain